MSRTHLMGAVSAAALSCFSFAHAAQTGIQGGGSTLAEFDYFIEFTTFNNSATSVGAVFMNPAPATGNNVLYWPSGSGSGQAAFLNDDLTCDANKVDGNNGGACSGTVGGAQTVHYGASDATLSSTQIAQWNSSSVGMAAAGDLIQLPSMGVGISIPVVNSKVTQNGATTKNVAVMGGVVLNDNDLCGIFSGKITDWSKTSAAATTTAGPITVVYRNDGSGTSFLLLNHLSAVCTAANSNFPIPLNVSVTFANAFAGGAVPANFQGEKGSSGVASYLDNATGVANAPTVTSAIGYLSPDFTTVDPMSNAVLANGQKSTLVVAAVLNVKTPYIPTVLNVTNGLLHPAAGYSQNTTPPTTAAQFMDPTTFVPLIQKTANAYPIVGYTTFDFAQCYHNTVAGTGVITFLKDHFGPSAAYQTTITNNGFVPVAKSGAAKFGAAILNNIASNKGGLNVDIDDQTSCAGLAGR